MLLALETATDVCSVALADGDGQVVATAEALLPRQHAAQLVPLIREVLNRGGTDTSSLQAIAVSAGPGSYTGLRIGVSTAKGLAFAGGAALVSVPTLEGLALEAASLLEEEDRLLIALPSRRGEVYAAVYCGGGGDIMAVAGPSALRLEAIAEWLPPPAGTLYAAGPAARETLPHLDRATRLLDPLLVRPRAEAVARLGVRRLAEGLTEDLSAFEPSYLNPFEVRQGKSIFDRLPR